LFALRSLERESERERKREKEKERERASERKREKKREIHDQAALCRLLKGSRQLKDPVSYLHTVLGHRVGLEWD
jgi:hypothetical protein